MQRLRITGSCCIDKLRQEVEEFRPKCWRNVGGEWESQGEAKQRRWAKIITDRRAGIWAVATDDRGYKTWLNLLSLRL